MTPERKAYWQNLLNHVRLHHVLIKLPRHTLWAVGSMEDGPFARLILPNQNGGYTGGYGEAYADTPAEAVAAALAKARKPMTPTNTDRSEAQVEAVTRALSEAGGAANWEHALECARAAITAKREVTGEDVGLIEVACQPWEHSVGEPPEWDSPLLNVFDAGINYAAERMAEALGVTDYEWGDGSDDYASDVAMTFTNIMKAAGFTNEDGDLLTADRLASNAVDIERLREAGDAMFDFLGGVNGAADVRDKWSQALTHGEPE